MMCIRLEDPDFAEKVKVKLSSELIVRNIDVDWFNLYEHDNRRRPVWALRVRLGGLANTQLVWGYQIPETEIDSYYLRGADHVSWIIKQELDKAWNKLLYKPSV